MILNINGHRVNRNHIIQYYKRIISSGTDVYVEFIDTQAISIVCFNREDVADAILSLIDDVFENEIKLTYINSEHIKGNLDRAKDSF
jgi:hypothetical protein